MLHHAKVFVFLFSFVVQTAYWATMLSAFDHRFRECLCWPIVDPMRRIEAQEKLSVVSLVPPKAIVRLASTPIDDKAFCNEASDLNNVIPGDTKFLSPALEQLLKNTEAEIEICLEIGNDRSLASLQTKSEGLSSFDRSLISKHMNQNLPLEQLLNADALRPGEKYHLRMEVLFTPKIPALTL